MEITQNSFTLSTIAMEKQRANGNSKKIHSKLSHIFFIRCAATWANFGYSRCWLTTNRLQNLMFNWKMNAVSISVFAALAEAACVKGCAFVYVQCTHADYCYSRSLPICHNKLKITNVVSFICSSAFSTSWTQNMTQSSAAALLFRFQCFFFLDNF